MSPPPTRPSPPSTSPLPRPSAEVQNVLHALLESIGRNNCSDLHLRPGEPPFARADGRLSRAKAPSLSAALIEQIIAATSEHTLPGPESGSFEYSFEREGLGRYRGHAFRVRGGWGLAIRTIPLDIPDFAQLRLPPVVKAFAEHQPGLVLVTGPTNSGKSTTVASLLHYMATQEVLHILTLEDPVEYVLRGVGSCVSQRELGRDTPDWPSALAGVVREDPDVVFIGEIRDHLTLDTALQAAETGHCVFGTFHTPSALATIQRMVAMYEPAVQENVRARLADALRGILSQRLLPRRASRGRVLACEVLVGGYSVKDAIRDTHKTKTIPAILERSADQLMHTMDDSLRRLVIGELVEFEVARRYATSPTDFKRSLAMVG